MAFPKRIQEKGKVLMPGKITIEIEALNDIQSTM